MLISWSRPLSLGCAFLAVALALVACRGGGANPPPDLQLQVIRPTTPPSACANDRYPSEAPQFAGNEQLEYRTTPTGLRIHDFVQGTGKAASPDSIVEVHYTGWLTDGCIFDSSHLRGEPSLLPLSRVITGWQEGIGAMNVGGRRRLEVPSEQGYGPLGALPAIPPDAALIFDVELFGVFTEADISATQEALNAEAAATAEAAQTPAGQ